MALPVNSLSLLCETESTKGKTGARARRRRLTHITRLCLLEVSTACRPVMSSSSSTPKANTSVFSCITPCMKYSGAMYLIRVHTITNHRWSNSRWWWDVFTQKCLQWERQHVESNSLEAILLVQNLISAQDFLMWDAMQCSCFLIIEMRMNTKPELRSPQRAVCLMLLCLCGLCAVGSRNAGTAIPQPPPSPP